MPKFTSTTEIIQVGNGQYVGVLFVMPVIITIQNYRFEVFTLVSEIHENVDVVLSNRNLFKLEGVIDLWNSSFSSLNRSIPFEEEITGVAITKLLDTKEHMTLTVKIKFIRNRATLKVKNDMHETMTFNATQMLGIIDLRSLGYYKIKQGVLQQNLYHIYHFESAHKVCDQLNRLIDMFRKEEKFKGTYKYPWLDDSDERKYVTDKEVLERYINLDNSCLNNRKRRN